MPYDVAGFETDEAARNLTLDEEGAYHRLLRHAWINGSIPDDLKRLAGICRIPIQTMRRLWPALARFWVIAPALLDPVNYPSNPGQTPDKLQTNSQQTPNKVAGSVRLVNNKLERQRAWKLAQSERQTSRAQLRWSKFTQPNSLDNKQSDHAAPALQDPHCDDCIAPPALPKQHSTIQQESLYLSNPLPLPSFPPLPACIAGNPDLVPLEPVESSLSRRQSSLPLKVLGEFQHVLLTEAEIVKLKALCDGEFELYVDRLDRWGEEEPGRFAHRKNHYLTIRNWFDRDRVRQNQAAKNEARSVIVASSTVSANGKPGWHMCRMCTEAHEWECKDPRCEDDYYQACQVFVSAFNEKRYPEKA